MARIRRWKEKLALACFALLFAIPRALAAGTRRTFDRSNILYSRLVTTTSGRMPLALELMN